MNIRQSNCSQKKYDWFDTLRNALRKHIFGALILLSFLFSSSGNAETVAEKKYISYVKNPNGMFLYPDYRDRKTRIFVPYRTRLLKSEDFITVKENDDHSEYFHTYRLDNKIYYNSDSDNPVIEFRIPDTEKLTYPHVRQALMYSMPFLNAKQAAKVPEYSPLKIHSVGDEWYEVEFEGTKGFIQKRDCIEAEPSEDAEISIKVKKKENEGFFLITTEKPVFHKYSQSVPGPNGDIPEYVTEESGTGKFNETIRSAERNGIRYYLLLTNSFSFGLADVETRFWISEKDGKFFTPREYSEYTLAKSKYSRNSELKTAAKSYMDSGINFQETEFKKFSSAKSVIYFLSLKKGIYSYGNNRNIVILEKNQNHFRPIFDLEKSKIYALDQLLPAEMISDMDGDGYPEFLYGKITRTGIQKGVSLASFKKGKIIPIADIDCGNYEVKGNALRCTVENENDQNKNSDKKETKTIKEYLFLNNALYLKLSKPTQ